MIVVADRSDARPAHRCHLAGESSGSKVVRRWWPRMSRQARHTSASRALSRRGEYGAPRRTQRRHGSRGATARFRAVLRPRGCGLRRSVRPVAQQRRGCEPSKREDRVRWCSVNGAGKQRVCVPCTAASSGEMASRMASLRISTIGHRSCQVAQSHSASFRARTVTNRAANMARQSLRDRLTALRAEPRDPRSSGELRHGGARARY